MEIPGFMSEQAIAIGNERMEIFTKRLISVKLNPHRFMCMMRERDKGERCTDPEHEKGVYPENKGCKCGIAAGIDLNIRFAEMDEKKFELLIESTMAFTDILANLYKKLDSI